MDPFRALALLGGKGPWPWPFSLIWVPFSSSPISHHLTAHLLVPTPKTVPGQRSLYLLALCLELSVPRSAHGCLSPVTRSQLEYHLGSLSWRESPPPHYPIFCVSSFMAPLHLMSSCVLFTCVLSVFALLGCKLSESRNLGAWVQYPELFLITHLLKEWMTMIA